jgi:hypothetical protein
MRRASWPPGLPHTLGRHGERRPRAGTRAWPRDVVPLLRHADGVLPWIAVRVFHDVIADDLGIALVPSPVELGDEIAVERHPWPLEVVDVVSAPPGAKVGAIVKVRAAVLHSVSGARFRR